jgi:5-deoxy-D-glucuronate isomerase
MQGALKKIEPPLPLDDSERMFWDKIVIARHEWTEIDKVLAVNLARCLAQYEVEQALVKAEGSVIVNERGTKVMNPRHSVIEQLTRRCVCLSGKVHVHAAATMGEVSAVRKKNAKKQEASKAFEALEDEADLIARPN